MKNKVVLQKFIAEAGYCSRRKAEELIKDGRVKVGEEIAALGQRAGDKDVVSIDGQKIDLVDKKIYIKLNKPFDFVCTSRKFKNEKNIFDLIKIKERVFVVGRLDKNSRGLVLLTNDGELTQKLTHPSFEHKKTYLVEINKFLGNPEVILNSFKKGIDIREGDGVVRAKEIKYLGNNKFFVILTEGKKRQLRRMFQAIGCHVKDLVRVGIGSLKLGILKEGSWEYLSEKEIKDLLK